MIQRKNFPRTVFKALSMVVFFFFPLFPAFGQNFPNQPIDLFVGATAGGGQYLSSRALGEGAQKELGVPVIVESKDGGGGTVLASIMARKKPDGYTLAVVNTTVLHSKHVTLNLTYDPFKDFTYILTYAKTVGGIVVKKDSPLKTLPDLIEYARKNPGALSYSTPGTGGGIHISIEYLAKQAKVKFKHVPFKGGAPASTALIGGHVDFMGGAGSHLPYVRQGVMRTLAVTGLEKRDPKFPDVPRVEEFGYKSIPMGSFVLIAPKGLPDPIFKKIEAAFRKSAHSPELHKLLDNIDLPFDFKDRRQFEEEFSETYKLYADFLKEIGLAK